MVDWIILSLSVLISAVFLTRNSVMNRAPFFFAVRVSEGFADSIDGRNIFMGYAKRAWLWCLGSFAVAALFFVFWTGEVGSILGFLAMPLVLIIGMGFTLSRARRETMPHAVPAPNQRRASLAMPTARGKGEILGLAAPYVLLFAAVLFTFWHWESLPETYPVHWNLAGEPDRWQTKAVWPILRPAIAGWWMMIYLQVLLSIRYRAGSGVMKRLPSAITVTTMALMAFIFSIIVLVPTFPQAWHSGKAMTGIILGIIILSNLVAIITIAIYANQETKQEDSGDCMDDRYWSKWGMYRNADDSALFVAKRIGMGFTLNMAHPKVALFILLNILAIALFLGLLVI